MPSAKPLRWLKVAAFVGANGEYGTGLNVSITAVRDLVVRTAALSVTDWLSRPPPRFSGTGLVMMQVNKSG